MLDKKTKDKLIKKYRTHESDTGSPQVQVAILTYEVKDLTEHLKKHKKDYSSRRGLLAKLNERRRHLRYLTREDAEVADKLMKDLKIKKIAYEPPPSEKPRSKKAPDVAPGSQAAKQKEAVAAKEALAAGEAAE